MPKTAHLNTEEACELLRCSASTLRRYARDNNWTRIRITQRHILYKREELEAHIEKNSYRIQD